MRQFVDNQVVHHEHGGFEDAPVEVEVVFGGTGGPAVFQVGDEQLVVGHAQGFGKMPDAGEQFFVGAFGVPGAEKFPGAGFLVAGDGEAARKADFVAFVVGQFQAVVAPQVQDGFAGDKFFFERFGRVFLRVIDFLVEPESFLVYPLADFFCRHVSGGADKNRAVALHDDGERFPVGVDNLVIEHSSIIV